MIPRSRVVRGGLVALVLAAGCSSARDPSAPPGYEPPPTVRPSLPATYRASGHAAAGDVFVHLFEWRWNDVAAECENVLGPAGYHAVQVSPPEEHAVIAGNPWWERYQAVSYSVQRSRSGTGAEFADMIERCRAAGVDIYVDAVINHMTAGAGTGINGTVYTKYEYPGLYTRSDFHASCAVSDYQSAANVQDCELLGLADLNTGSTAVRQKIADYLIALSRLGVAGFRIDAAKHIQPVELDSIVSLVNRTLVNEGLPRAYFFGEVIDYGGEGVRKSDYYGLGYASGGSSDITEFKFRYIADKFMGLGGQHLSQLNPDGPAGSQFSESAWGLMPSAKAVVFLENHDTQREGGIWYHDGQTYRLASLWMLAQPYGYPSIMSSYAFDRGSPGRDMGPPSDASGNTNPVACATSFETATIGQWVCEHRDPSIRGMVGFRTVVAGTGVSHWWDNGANAIAFSRGDKGFVAINRGTGSVSQTVTTGLAAGTYCDILTGGRTATTCTGTVVEVDAGHAVALTLGANSAIAIDSQTKL